MSKRNKLIATIIGVPVFLILTGYVSLRLLVLPPTPQAYCGKLIDLTTESLLDSGIDEEVARTTVESELGTIEECIKEEQDFRANTDRGLFTIRNKEQCVIYSSTLGEAEACEF